MQDMLALAMTSRFIYHQPSHDASDVCDIVVLFCLLTYIDTLLSSITIGAELPNMNSSLNHLDMCGEIEP